MASAANAATTACRKSGEGIMARRLHLADERPWRGHVEQNGLFGPTGNNCPDRHVHKRSIVRQRARSGNRPNMSWCSTQNRQDGFVLAVPKDYAKPLHRLQRFKTLAECNEAGLHAAFFRNISVRYGGTPQTISVSDAITRSFEPSTRGGAFRDLNVCVPPYPGDQRAMWQLLGLPGRRPHCHAHAELCTSLILRWKNDLHARAQILAQLRLGRTFVRSIPEAIIDIFGDLRLD